MWFHTHKTYRNDTTVDQLDHELPYSKTFLTFRPGASTELKVALILRGFCHGIMHMLVGYVNPGECEFPYHRCNINFILHDLYNV